MIIDTEEHTLTISLARQMLTALVNFPGISDRTQIEFNYYSGSGWTVSVVEEEEPDEPPTPGLIPSPPLVPMPTYPSYPYPQYPLKPYPFVTWNNNPPKPDFQVYAEAK